VRASSAVLTSLDDPTAAIGKIGVGRFEFLRADDVGNPCGAPFTLYRDPCLPDAGPMLSGTLGRRCFRLGQKSFLIFLIVAPENDGKDERHNERRPSKWSSDSTDAFSKHVSA
jgi:hypothetical protein